VDLIIIPAHVTPISVQTRILNDIRSYTIGAISKTMRLKHHRRAFKYSYGNPFSLLLYVMMLKFMKIQGASTYRNA